MTRAYIALGGNVEPRMDFLRRAVQMLHRCGEVLQVASLYRSAPYGPVKQEWFLNSALLLATGLAPQPLLKQLKEIERRVGRKPRERWGPREVDLDIIFYGHEQVRLPQLHIPHRDYLNRPFVLRPLAELDPDFVPPACGKTLAQLAAECPEDEQLTVVSTNWMIDGTEL